MKKSYAILGLGKFGSSVAEELALAGAEVMAVDIDEERVHRLSDVVTYAIRADICDVETMQSLGLSNMDAVVVAITQDLNASAMGTIFAKEQNVPFVLAKAQDEIHAKILQKLGADKVLVPEKESGVRIARSLLSGKFKEFIELSHHVVLVEMDMKPEWEGKNLIELDLRRKEKINVIAVRADGHLVANPDPEAPLKAGSTLVVTMDKKNVNHLMK
ncbi:MAG: TrkA family potassium uptake protein [Lachnospiraceae bacterium]|nr:TrkA family potassium uptake protein [Lachnospiraceae bacterium]